MCTVVRKCLNLLNLGYMEVVKELAKNEGIKHVYNELAKLDYEEWHLPGIKAVIQFAFHVFLVVLNASSGETGLPRNLENNKHSKSKFDPNLIDNGLAQQILATQFEEDQRLLDLAIEKHVFSFITSEIVRNERFHSEVAVFDF